MSRRFRSPHARRLDARLVRRLIARFARQSWVHPRGIRWSAFELFTSAFEERTLRRRLEWECVLQADLDAVHRWEQHDLLRLVVELQLATSLEGRFLSAPMGNGPDEQFRRERCAQELGCAMADGAAVCGELLACAIQERAHWPSAIELARALDPGADGATDDWYLLRALFSMGRSAEALEIVERMDLARLTRARRSSLLECMALDLEQRGQTRQAQRYFERAAILGGTVRTDLSGALLALEFGEQGLAEDHLLRLQSRAGAAAVHSMALQELMAKRDLMKRETDMHHLFGLERFLADLDWPPSDQPWTQS